jgi:hypothetical protein
MSDMAIYRQLTLHTGARRYENAKKSGLVLIEPNGLPR